MRRRKAPLPQPDLNLTNLMDIVLCILVVFMITAPLMTQGVKVELPKSDSPPVDEKNSVTVSFDARQRVFVDGEETSVEDFPDDFSRAWGGDVQKAVLIQGDRSVPYGLVLETVGEIRKVGATKIGFLTEPPDRK